MKPVVPGVASVGRRFQQSAEGLFCAFSESAKAERFALAQYLEGRR